jgi:hypothetical protein
LLISIANITNVTRTPLQSGEKFYVKTGMGAANGVLWRISGFMALIILLIAMCQNHCRERLSYRKYV